jgi:Caspase domain
MRRTQYRRGGGGGWIGALIVLAICGAVGGGGYYVWKEMEKKDKQAKDQEKNLNKDVNAPPPEPEKPSQATSGVFPRRMLFMHLSKYIYFNNLTAGTTLRGQDVPTSTARNIASDWRITNDPDKGQLFVLSDTGAGKKSKPPIKLVLEKAITDFCVTSREQDRIVIYFGGHAMLLDDKAYLVPIEGEPDQASTLIPIAEVFANLQACKAQQKVLILDVCRFNSVYGNAKPGSEPMSEKLAELLHKAPAGVQVITSCSAKETAAEVQENGSEFLTAWRTIAMRSRRASQKSEPTAESSIPITKWMDDIKAFLSSKRADRVSQTVKITGTDPSSSIVKADEPAADRVAWAEVSKGASGKLVESIFDASKLPGLRKDLDVPSDIADAYPFDAMLLRPYQPEGDATKSKLREATVKALQVVRESWKFGEEGLRDTFMGDVDDKARKDAIADQQAPAVLELNLTEQIQALQKLSGELANEKSKHWQVLYQYTLAQLLMRWAFNEEYRLSLGKIRTDNLPKPEGGKAAGWRLASTDKMMSKKDVQEKATEAKELLVKIADDHKGTPWEVLAKMHKNIALGLKWEVIPQTMKEDDKADGEMKK